MWMARHQPQVYEKTVKVLGSKDYINYLLTGQFAIDPSYASGTDVYKRQGMESPPCQSLFPLPRRGTRCSSSLP